MTQLKRNIVASYAGQIYVTIIGVVLVPLYVEYMGVEAYGLVGFYAMLQTWFVLLDMGLTPTMAREAARYRGNAVDGLSLRRLLRALESIFIAVALAGSVSMIVGAGSIARSWLKLEQLPIKEVQHALMLIGVIIALRWVGDLYRGVINGFEHIVWLNIFNIAIATGRFVFVIPVFIHVGTTPTVFFGYQLVLGVVETTILVTKTYRLMPKRDGSNHPLLDWQPLRKVLRFSLAIAFTSLAWVLATQTDKLILSKLLPLSEYAYFTLAVLVAGGVTVISVPISGALMPRLVAMSAAHDEQGLLRLYRSATQMTAVMVIPTTLVLALFSEAVLWIWTGDAEIARKGAPVLAIYALGNGVMALGAFPYYLQYAKGDLQLHLIGSALFVAVLIPSIIYLTATFGVRGAAYAWLGSNLAYFVFWIPKIHRRFVRGLHRDWLLSDLAGVVLGTSLCGLVARPWVKLPVGRAPAALFIMAVALGLLVIAGAASSWLRQMVRPRLFGSSDWSSNI